MTQKSTEACIKTFLAKYSPEISAELRAARTQMRKLFPRGYELVFDNYNALVFAFAPTDRSSQAFISVAGYPKWVTLFFLRGVDLKDPHKLLEGAGSQVRSVRLTSAGQLVTRPVQALIAQATKPHRVALLQAEPLQTIIKSVSKKQRPRRPARKSPR